MALHLMLFRQKGQSLTKAGGKESMLPESKLLLESVSVVDRLQIYEGRIPLLYAQNG